MAITVLPGQSYGSKIGEGLGNALSGGLQNIANIKLQQILQQQERSQQQMQSGKGYEAVGLPKNIGLLPQEVQKALVRGWADEGGIQRLLEGLSNQQMQPTGLNHLQTPQETPYQSQLLEPSTPMQSIVQQALGIKPYQEQGITTSMPSFLQEQSKQPLTSKALQQQTSNLSAMEEPWQILKTKPVGKTQKELFNNARKEQHYIDKETLPYREAINKKGGSVAKMSDIYLDRMSKLIDKGDLPYAAMHNLRKALGGPIAGAIAGGVTGSFIPGLGTVGGALAGAAFGKHADVDLAFLGGKDAQEFTKLGLEFMSRMKDVFGGKVSDREVSQFLESIPNLSQTDDGKKAIIRNMKLTLDAWKHKKKVMDQVIKQHGGYVPRNIEDIVEQQSGPYMTNVAKRFVEGY